ncbi:2-C-methyl-D-erythritol 4-phosphate cytidylyltransferase [Isoalcanivorax indicus]|uniref:2-C-methyl-D-erythritol 4-phosphate cytidylyltransferase n=1 Tax=Isoalcanivorax indicus TaxID=2202653 RepID=UPI000DB94473|nr:2-C-methyl-D-erythritol 4-phosphate cytidylyltransferase [Isoalcanivorax indicus]
MLPADARVFALVPAAGSGTRMAAALPKQYLSLDGRTLAEHTVNRLLACARIERVMVAVAADDPWWSALPVARQRRVSTTIGGAERADSVLRGVQALADWARDDDWVLVHDMARPCLRVSDIHRLLDACGEQGAILASPVTDTVKQADAEGRISATLPRSCIWRALTPQLFPLGALREALQAALANGLQVTDEASAMEARGWQPVLVLGRADNIKVTVPEDLALAAFYLAQQEDA